MEDYFERVVETLTGAGYRWYETANFCRTGDGRDLRARHNLGYWLGHDYLGVGIGAVSTVGGLRWRNAPEPAALPRRAPAPASGRSASSSSSTPGRPRASASCSGCGSTSRSSSRGSTRRSTRTRWRGSSGRPRSRPTAATLELTRRGRFLGGGVTAELLVES